MKIKIDKKFLIIFISLLMGGFLVFYLTKSKSIPFENSPDIITVFKSPTCECCGGYVEYLKQEGLKVKAINTDDMLSIKEKYQIPPELESCHTAIVGNYFIEGHVPIEAINKLLTEKPKIDGITLPGMPLGSPGMGGIKTGLFKIYGLTNGIPSEFGEF